MSILTRVFVLLLSILSIALSAFVIAAFAQQENWRVSAMDWRGAALAAQAKERAASSNAALEQQRSLARRSQDQQTISELQAQLQTKETEVAESERKLAEAQNSLAIEQAQVTSGTENSKVILAALNHEKEFASKLATRNSELERRNVDLNDRVQEMTTSLTMARSMVRALKQQIESMGMARGSSTDESQIPGGLGIVESNTPSVESPSVTSGMTAPIRAEVTSVKGDLASISVGNADGVAPGMRFLIYRAGGDRPEYLATLRITRVDANESAGEIEMSEGEVRTGDSARDEASFALRR